MRVGLIADGDGAERLRAAVTECVLLHPLGQARVPIDQRLPAVPSYDDPRILLAESNLEAVLLATSTREDLTLADLAAEQGLHVWRLPPVGRSFAEATECLTRVRQLDTLYRVASWWEYVVDHVWHEVAWPENFEPRLSEVSASAPGPAITSWRAGLGESAGGALVDCAYAPLEALIAVRGLPETAVGAVGHYRSPLGSLPREAEDTAIAILRYSHGGMAVVRATWDLPPNEQRTVHHGPGATATLTPDEVQLVDPAGTAFDRRPLPGDFLAHELLRFAEMVRAHTRDRALAPLDRHLAVSALLDAIYLSARTGHPESPRKLYEVQKWPEPRH